jgi:uncharacterized protein YjbI with pentapeptide repeats
MASNRKVSIYDNSRPDAQDARGRYYHGLLFLKLPFGFESATFYKCVAVDAPSDIFGLKNDGAVKDCTIESANKENKYAPTVIEDVDIRGIGFENVIGYLTFKHVDLSRGYFHNFSGILNFVACDLDGVRISRTGPLMLNANQSRYGHEYAQSTIRIENCDLNGLTLENIDMPRFASSLNDLEIKGVTFRRCNFIGGYDWDERSRDFSVFVSKLDGFQFIADNHFENVFVAQEHLIGIRGFNVLLPNSDLSDVDLRDIDPNAYFHLDRCNLQRANFSGVDLSVTSQRMAKGRDRICRSFIEADLSGTVFDGAKFGSVDFNYADLRGASVKGVSFVNKHGVGLEGDVAMFLGSKLAPSIFKNISIGKASSDQSYSRRRTRRSYASMQSYSMVFSLSDLSLELLEHLGISKTKRTSSEVVDFLKLKDRMQVLNPPSHDLGGLRRVLSQGKFVDQLRELNYRTGSLQHIVDLACEVGVASGQTLNLIFLGKGSRVLGLQTTPSRGRHEFSSFSLPSGFDWSESEIIHCTLNTYLEGVNFSKSVLACKFVAIDSSLYTFSPKIEVFNCDFSGSSIYVLTFDRYKALRGCSFRQVVCDRLVISTMDVQNCVFDQGIYNSITCAAGTIENTSFVDADIAKLIMDVDYLIFRNCDFSGAHIVWNLSALDGRRDFEQEPLFENCFFDDNTRFQNLSIEQLKGLVYKGS